MKISTNHLDALTALKKLSAETEVTGRNVWSTKAVATLTSLDASQTSVALRGLEKKGLAENLAVKGHRAEWMITDAGIAALADDTTSEFGRKRQAAQRVAMQKKRHAAEAAKAAANFKLERPSTPVAEMSDTALDAAIELAEERVENAHQNISTAERKLWIAYLNELSNEEEERYSDEEEPEAMQEALAEQENEERREAAADEIPDRSPCCGAYTKVCQDTGELMCRNCYETVYEPVTEAEAKSIRAARKAAGEDGPAPAFSASEALGDDDEPEAKTREWWHTPRSTRDLMAAFGLHYRQHVHTDCLWGVDNEGRCYYWIPRERSKRQEQAVGELDLHVKGSVGEFPQTPA